MTLSLFAAAIALHSTLRAPSTAVAQSSPPNTLATFSAPKTVAVITPIS